MCQDILIKILNLGYIYFDNLYIIGRTGDQNEAVESINDEADVEFFDYIEEISAPCDLIKNLEILYLMM